MQPSVIQTPLPLSQHVRELDFDAAELMRTVREWLSHPAHLEGGAPERLAAYCFDLLNRFNTREHEATLDILQPFRSVLRTSLENLTPEVLTEVLDLIFKEAWCWETATPRRRTAWTTDMPWIGQEAVSALLLNKLFGGRIEESKQGTALCIWNRLATGTAINPAYRTTLPSKGEPVKQEALFQVEGFRRSLDTLEARFMKSVTAWGVAAACLAEQTGWKPPSERWDCT